MHACTHMTYRHFVDKGIDENGEEFVTKAGEAKFEVEHEFLGGMAIYP